MFLLAEDGVFTVGADWLLTVYTLLWVAAAVAIVFAVYRWLMGIARGTSSGAELPRASAHDAQRWITTGTLAVASCALAAALGAGLAVFRLSWIVLLLGAALFALIVRRPKNALPLAVVAFGLCAGAANTNGKPGRIDRSTGMLVTAPATSAEAEAQPWRRGLGSVLVDLRETQLRTGSPTRITASSDAGRVVVALPQDRCVNVRVTALRGPGRLSGAEDWPSAAVTRLARDAAIIPAGENQRGAFPAFNPPDGAVVPSGSSGTTGGPQPGRKPADLALFGQTVWAQSDSRAMVVSRQVRDRAPWVELNLRAQTAIVVRDYPDGDRQLGAPYSARTDEYPELGNSDWPANEVRARLPFPGDQRIATWDRWKRKHVGEAARLARTAAGPCAGRDELASHWTTVDTSDQAQPDAPRGVSYPSAEMLAELEAWNTQTGVRVNGLGTVENIGVVRKPAEDDR